MSDIDVIELFKRMTSLTTLRECISEKEAERKIELKYFVHYDDRTLDILGISLTDTTGDGESIYEIPTDLALKLLSGEESLTNWSIGFKDGNAEFAKKDITSYDRLDTIPVAEYVPTKKHVPEAAVRISIKKNGISIKYDGDLIQSLNRPLKLYFTRLGDPSHLLMALSLNSDVLDQILVKNKIKKWPNPINLSIEDPDDVSIYGLKDLTTVSVTKWNIR